MFKLKRKPKRFIRYYAGVNISCASFPHVLFDFGRVTRRFYKDINFRIVARKEDNSIMNFMLGDMLRRISSV